MEVADHVSVMYAGRIVESGSADVVFDHPAHPYTQALLSAAPRIGGPRVTENFSLQGEPPDPSNVPSGCRFRTRCQYATSECADIDPELDDENGHGVACLRWRELSV